MPPQYLAAQDGLLIATDHSSYDWEFIARHAHMIVDTRNATRHVHNARARIYRA